MTGFDTWLLKRTLKVRERIQRLNPHRTPGTILRGYHPHARSDSWVTGAMGFRSVCRQYGRDAWDKMPKCAFKRDGKRRSIPIEALKDQLWKVAENHPLRMRP